MADRGALHLGRKLVAGDGAGAESGTKVETDAEAVDGASDAGKQKDA